MSEWRALPATKSVLAEQALKLCEDMKVARKEEKLLTEKGSPQTVTFELPDDGNQKITALRAVVAARAFKGGMLEGKDPNTVSVPKEAGEGASVDVNVVFVKGVSMATMEQAVEHMYASDIELTDASVYDLLVAANLMGLEGLKALCACMLSAPSKLKPATVCKILVAAHSAEAPALKEACLAFLDSDIKDVAGRGGYGLEELPADIMAEVCGRDSLSMGELELFKIVMRWGENERARLTKLQTGAAPPPPAEGGGGAVADVAAAPGVSPPSPPTSPQTESKSPFFLFQGREGGGLSGPLQGRRVPNRLWRQGVPTLLNFMCEPLWRS
ncbi:hypothetical protein T484DRAFT_3499132 [Baffinella frigidus]|nr:hypothetical protein T484DRAFT_3499132 [Cryptophyta sp. CCMP2293]